MKALTKASQLKRPRRNPKRLRGKALLKLRMDCYERAGANCQGKKCGKLTYWHEGHMHHVKHRSLGGKDELANVQWLCASCHQKHHCPKACPKKERL